jgi:hypothetical protein
MFREPAPVAFWPFHRVATAQDGAFSTGNPRDSRSSIARRTAGQLLPLARIHSQPTQRSRDRRRAVHFGVRYAIDLRLFHSRACWCAYSHPRFERHRLRPPRTSESDVNELGRTGGVTPPRRCAPSQPVQHVHQNSLATDSGAYGAERIRPYQRGFPLQRVPAFGGLGSGLDGPTVMGRLHSPGAACAIAARSRISCQSANRPKARRRLAIPQGRTRHVMSALRLPESRARPLSAQGTKLPASVPRALARPSRFPRDDSAGSVPHCAPDSPRAGYRPFSGSASH